MKENLTGNEKVVINLVAGDDSNYNKVIQGTSIELQLIDFPLKYLKGNTGEMTGYSDKIESFVNNCSDDFMMGHGSYDEFWSTYDISATITFEDGTTLESEPWDPFA